MLITVHTALVREESNVKQEVLENDPSNVHFQSSHTQIEKKSSLQIWKAKT